MHHNIFGKKLSRSKNERRNLFRNLMVSMIEHGSIKTTKAKAQAVRSELEQLITKAKKGTEHMRRDVLSTLVDRSSVASLFDMAGTRFTGRNSGYTRITKIGPRLGDGSEMVVLSFVDEAIKQEVVKIKKEVAKKVEPKAKKPTIARVKKTK